MTGRPQRARVHRLIHQYVAYGLRLDSDFELGPLVPRDDALPAGATIECRAIPELGADARQFGGMGFWHSLTGTLIEFGDSGPLLVRDGREILCDPPSGRHPQGLQAAILGPALGLLLHQRGHVVLHASAVAVDGQALVLLGHSGAGKSALADALIRRGHSLVADDLVAVDLSGGQPVVAGGYPQQMLWPGAVERLVPTEEKRSVRVAKFDPGPRPLGGIYVLGRASGGAPVIEGISPRDAYIELVRYSYVAALMPLGDAERHLRQSEQLLEHVELKRLCRASNCEPADLGRLVERDFRGF